MRPRHRAQLGLAVALIASLVMVVAGSHPTRGFAAHPWAPNGRPALSGMSADQIAIQALQKYRGITLNVPWEEGLQAYDPLQYSSPLFEKLTGIKIHLIQIPYVDLYTKQIAEHEAGSGAYDVISYSPNWTADFVADGVVMSLDDMVKKYYPAADFNDYMPLFKTIALYNGHRYGLFDDGDHIVLYYRTDLFNDPKNKSLFQKEYGYPLSAPKTWPQMQDVSSFFTKHYAPNIYGYSQLTAPGNNIWDWFYAQIRENGGQFYDPKTMKAAINGPAGVKTLQQMVALSKTGPPGQLQWTGAQLFTSWLGGHLAMTSFWPPLGRWSAGYKAIVLSKQLSFLPKNVISGEVGYSVMPGGHSEMAGGYDLGVSPDSKYKEAAYLYIQWLTSPKISLQRVELPYALRDPYRLSHINSSSYRHLWPQAPQYLNTLLQIDKVALLDNFVPGAAQYDNALDKAINAALSGMDPKQALDTAAQQWDAITQRLGVDKQRAAYLAYLNIPGSQISNTISH